MAVQKTRAYAPLSQLRRRIGQWWDRHRALRELTLSDERDLQRVLNDLNMTEADLRDAVTRGAYPKLLLPEMLDSLGLDAERIDKDYPWIAADLKRVCAQCSEKRRCRCELDAGTAASDYGAFCYNATTLEALVAEAPEATAAPEAGTGAKREESGEEGAKPTGLRASPPRA